MDAYLMLEVSRQRTIEWHEAARQAGLARAVRKAIRARRSRARAADAISLPSVPDYVDGTFRQPEDEAVTERAGAAG